MTARGLGGRLALASARRRTAAMVALLVMALLVVELQRTADYVTLGFIDDREALRSPFAHALFQEQIAVLCLGPLMAGVIIDRHGVRRSVTLTIVGWCALVSIGVSCFAPLPYRLGAPLADELVPGFILCAALVCLVRRLDPRRRGVAAIIVLLLFHAARERPHLATAMLRWVAAGWQETMFLLVAVGALVATIWLAAFREPAAPAVEPRAFSPVDLILAVGTVAWSAPVLALLAPPAVEPLALARGAVAANLPALSALAVALAAAFATDRLSRPIGPPPASRVAALLPAFLLAALAGLAESIGRLPDAALDLVVPLVGGLLQLAGLLAIDRAPRRAPGVFIGIVVAAHLAAMQYLGPLARNHLPHGALLVAAGLGGAGWGGLLLRLSAGSARRGRGGDAACQPAAGEEDEQREHGHAGADEGQAGVA